MGTTFTFLGTGTSQGVPVIGCDCSVCTSGDPRDQRLRAAGLLQRDGANVAIDVGPDFRQQILRTGIRSLDAILLTHEHNDHVIGLDEVRPFNFMSRKSMEVLGEKRVLEEVRSRFAYIFSSQKYPGAPSVEMESIHPGEKFEIGGMSVEPVRIMHGNLPILAFKTGSFAYCTDVKRIPDESRETLTNLDILVISALHRTKHHSHLNLEEALEVIRQLNPSLAYLTHASHRMGLYEDVQQLLPSNVFLAYDGLTLNIS